ncbi:CLUMA_CG014538, isoform A [Clunio marinus]|uniref:CLUMA_CG014538, isoform A n=1 Tax=Clunio marinus TaxID=568069 RepID=A0A1J1IN56_9DIPT|nr:CLUMA_CG014538, isoform A [Clunio marinus]
MFVPTMLLTEHGDETEIIQHILSTLKYICFLPAFEFSLYVHQRFFKRQHHHYDYLRRHFCSLNEKCRHNQKPTDDDEKSLVLYVSRYYAVPGDNNICHITSWLQPHSTRNVRAREVDTELESHTIKNGNNFQQGTERKCKFSHCKVSFVATAVTVISMCDMDFLKTLLCLQTTHANKNTSKLNHLMLYND